MFVNMCMREGERERELMRKVGLKACPSFLLPHRPNKPVELHAFGRLSLGSQGNPKFS
jgi:hypothetical protein